MDGRKRTLELKRGGKKKSPMKRAGGGVGAEPEALGERAKALELRAAFRLRREKKPASRAGCVAGPKVS